MRLSIIDPERCVGCMLCMFACTRRFGEGGLSKSAIWVRSIGGVENGFRVIVCRACEEPPCARVCPTNALMLRDGGGVLLKFEKCIGCGLCKDACILNAVFWDDLNSKPIICIHCGFCAEFCPHGVLKLGQTNAEQVK